MGHPAFVDLGTPRSWVEFAAVACAGGLVGSGVEYDLPGAVGLLAPDGDVAAGGGDGVAVGVFAVALEVSPGVADVAGGSENGFGGGPGELVDPCLLYTSRCV